MSTHDLRYYNRQGEPITTHEWTQLFGDPAYRFLRQDEIHGSHLSTVWLGIDHGAGGQDDPPVIFETMWFADDEEGQWRYSTEAAALSAHQAMLDYINAHAWSMLPERTVLALGDIANRAYLDERADTGAGDR